MAVIDLAERLVDFDALILWRPVARRGIPGDPAREAKREFAVTDARRLFKRTGLTMRRTRPIDPDETAFLAEWAASSLSGPALTKFCVAAMRQLWLVGDENEGEDRGIEPRVYAELWREAFGHDPPPAAGPDAVRANERAMKRRGPYDTPAAWVHGRWFFAHDRLPQIADRLDDLDWRVSG